MQDEGNIFTEQPLYHRDSQRSRVKRVPNKQSQQNFSSRSFFKLSFLLLLVSIFIWGWIKLTNPETFPIEHVQIKGEYPRVNREALRQTILPFVDNGLIKLDKTGLQDRLLQLPWVATAIVKRVWPNKILVTLTEQKPIARFGKNILLNAEGDVFNVNVDTIPEGLPLFVGPSDQKKLMIQAYQAIEQVLAQLNRKITILTLDTQQFWRLQLDNGIVLLIGKIDPLPRLQRFVAVYPQVIGTKAATIDYVDLRYSHGIAVHFKNQTSAITS